MDGGRIRHRMWRPYLRRPYLRRPCLSRLGPLGSACLIAAGLSLFGVAVGTGQAAASVPSLSHVFVIVEENNGYHDVIGNRAAPNLNYLAKTFGVETDYFGVSPDSSESNYVGLLGGSTFGVTSDDAYWKNRISAPSLISQLDQAHITWKAYLQALPYPGYEGICYPAKCNGAPDSDPLFVSKHDAIQNYSTSLSTTTAASGRPSGRRTPVPTSTPSTAWPPAEVKPGPWGSG